MKNLECIFAPEWAILKEDKKFDFEISLPKLRHTNSLASSNSWVKCKKKLQEGEYHTAIKSFYHSIRIPMFASQIARYGKITDFSIANFIWNRLIFQELPAHQRKDSKWDWDSLNSEFKITYNLMLSLFRRSTTKNPII
jgi:hypothetical protein